MAEPEEAPVPEQPEEPVKPESPENQEAAGDTTQDKPEEAEAGQPESEQPEKQEEPAGEAAEAGAEGENEVGEPVSEKPEQGAEVTEQVSEQPEQEAEVSEPVSEQPEPGPEGAEVSESVPQVEEQEVVGDAELGQPTELLPEQPEGQEITGEETTTEAPEDIELVAGVEAEQPVEEFVGSIVDTIFSKAVDILGLERKSSDVKFVSGIVDKIVSHAVGEETPEESEESVESLKLEEIEQPGEEEISGAILKYLQGPESLRFEEAVWKPEMPVSCVSYMNVVEYARKFVDDILERARDICLLRYGVSVRYRKKPAEVQNIRWPSIENFTIDLGRRKIDEYIQMTFEVEENWLYKINFIAAQSDLSSDVYLYEAIFCIPTPPYPVAQATVSIYFNCDVSRVKPRECPIDVSYTIESLKEIMVPGKAVVNDDILLRLVYSKLSVFKSLYF